MGTLQQMAKKKLSSPGIREENVDLGCLGTLLEVNPHQTEVVTRTLDTGSFQGKQKKHFECHGTRGFASKRDACLLEFRLWVLFF